MEHRDRNFYFGTLALIAALTAYPILMGVLTALRYFANGAIEAAQYPRYVIPYAPLGLAILLVALLLPLFWRLKRHAGLIASVIGGAVFFTAEFCLEGMAVAEQSEVLPLDAWQYSLCIATPEVLQSIGQPIYAAGNPAFKLHFYLIAMLILLCMIGILFGLRELHAGCGTRTRPLIALLASTVLFVALCAVACLTAFYRNGTRFLSPLSACLTGGFFVVFGVTAGLYVTFLLWKKGRRCRIWASACTAFATAFAMYAGELILMDGALFQFGTGWFFAASLGPFALCDLLIVVLAGVLSGVISSAISKSLKN